MQPADMVFEQEKSFDVYNEEVQALFHMNNLLTEAASEVEQLVAHLPEEQTAVLASQLLDSSMQSMSHLLLTRIAAGVHVDSVLCDDPDNSKTQAQAPTRACNNDAISLPQNPTVSDVVILPNELSVSETYDSHAHAAQVDEECRVDAVPASSSAPQTLPIPEVPLSLPDSNVPIIPETAHMEAHAALVDETSPEHAQIQTDIEPAVVMRPLTGHEGETADTDATVTVGHRHSSIVSELAEMPLELRLSSEDQILEQIQQEHIAEPKKKDAAPTDSSMAAKRRRGLSRARVMSKLSYQSPFDGLTPVPMDQENVLLLQNEGVRLFGWGCARNLLV